MLCGYTRFEADEMEKGRWERRWGVTMRLLSFLLKPSVCDIGLVALTCQIYKSIWIYIVSYWIGTIRGDIFPW
jgi:hypothetical protein